MKINKENTSKKFKLAVTTNQLTQFCLKLVRYSRAIIIIDSIIFTVLKNMNPQPIRIKKFIETFPICTLGLFMSLVSPYTKMSFKRVILLISAWFLVIPMALITIPYMLECIHMNDIENLSKQLLIIIVIIIYITKTAIVFTNQNTFGGILEIISDDLTNVNEMEDAIKVFANESIRLGKISERIMVVYSLTVATLYVIVSLISTTFSYLFHDEFKRYMIHPTVIRNFEEKQYQSPYYEIIWIYQFCCCIIISPTFAGVDASFGIACAHLSLKLKLVTYRLQEIFRKSLNVKELEENLMEVISDHIEAKKFYNLICEMYQDWLLVVYLLSSSVISLTLYQLSVEGLNPQFLIFFTCSLIHMYFPCYYASLVDKVRKLSFRLFVIK